MSSSIGGVGPLGQTEQTEEALLKAGALQRAILNSANFSSIAPTPRVSFRYSMSGRNGCRATQPPKC